MESYPSRSLAIRTYETQQRPQHYAKKLSIRMILNYLMIPRVFLVFTCDLFHPRMNAFHRSPFHWICELFLPLIHSPLVLLVDGNLIINSVVLGGCWDVTS
jgi:hypothetical protein